MQRDLIGYGNRRPQIEWPNGAAVAVSIVVNYEEGAEFSIEQGDPATERFGEVQSIVPDGVRDISMEQMFSYGMRSGLWRFLDAFDEHGHKATFFMCGRAIERAPELANAVVARGHEPACHSWRWETHAKFKSIEEEREVLERCIAVTEKATGERPYGFFCRGSQSVHTRPLLSELGFEYDSNAYDDDLPYYDDTAPSGPLLILPYALDSNDMKFLHPYNTFATPDQFFDYLRAGVEVLLDEGRRGSPKLFNIGLHLRITGRPARFAAVRSLLSYLHSLGDEVWVARRIDIARHFRENHPPT
ncbi:MAG: peptidoglycan/xylan/chitin deacetylase (PgdA/CDA1 family) [Gammaproteobacteria bacterium]|jgi:peptidoglycan/xylan/chitin deacetylase (PgdA/CDA1 family)